MQRDVDAPARRKQRGEERSERTFGILTVRSPAVVVTSLSRVPLRWVVRVAVRSSGPAPTCAVASASINACSIACSSRRITSPPSALRSASVKQCIGQLEQGRLIQGHRVSPLL